MEGGDLSRLRATEGRWGKKKGPNLGFFLPFAFTYSVRFIFLVGADLVKSGPR